MSVGAATIYEYRGVSDLVAAEVLTDDNGVSGYTTGTVFPIAGVAEIQKAANSSSEAHYYDNIPAVVVENTSADTVTISVSAIPIDVLAQITGQDYDSTKGALVEGDRTFKYFAIGYRTQTTDGKEMFVWRYKGSFTIPDQTNTTKRDDTSANGQELVFTGISTTHKFSNGKQAKALVVDTSKELADVSTFFDTVTTPDDLTANTSYTLSITQAEDTVVVVKRNGETLTNGATIYGGDYLLITVAGGTLEVNGVDFTSGNIQVVSGNVTVISTATPDSPDSP